MFIQDQTMYSVIDSAWECRMDWIFAGGWDDLAVSTDDFLLFVIGA